MNNKKVEFALSSNITNQDEFLKKVFVVIKHLRNISIKSLGPSAATTFMAVDPANVLMTKDGYHIINDVKINDYESNVISSLVKDLAMELNCTSGDGTTSTVDAAYHFFTMLYKKIKDGSFDNIRCKDIVELTQQVADKIVKIIIKNKRTIGENSDVLHRIATVSLNNDSVKGSVISEIYDEVGEDAMINMKMGSSEDTFWYKETDGVVCPFGRYDELFVNNGIGQNVLEKTAILIFRNHVSSDKAIRICRSVINQVRNAMVENARTEGFKKLKYYGVTIIASGFSNTFLNEIRDLIYNIRKEKSLMNFNLIKFPTSEWHNEMIYDLSLMTGANIIMDSQIDNIETMLTTNDGMEVATKMVKEELAKGGINADVSLPDDGTIKDKNAIRNIDSLKGKKLSIDSFVGYAEKAVSTNYQTVFFGTTPFEDEVEIERSRIISELEEAKKQQNNVRVFELKKRLGTIDKTLVTLEVGGIDDNNKKADMELLEDAIKACKSTTLNGYNIGCNMAITLACDELMSDAELTEEEKIIVDIIKTTFVSVYFDVIHNGISDTEQCKEIIKESIERKACYNMLNGEYTQDDIINPTETDVEILKHVTSLIPLLATCNQYITNNVNHPIDCTYDELESDEADDLIRL